MADQCLWASVGSNHGCISNLGLKEYYENPFHSFLWVQICLHFESVEDSPHPPKDPQPPPPNSPSCNSSSSYDDVCKINNTLFFASRRLIHVDTFIDIDSLQIHSDIVEMNSTHFQSSEEKNLWVEEFFSLLSNHFKLVRCLNEMVKAGISIFCLGLIWELPSIISRIKWTIKITTLLGFGEQFISWKKIWANWNTANTVCALIIGASTSRVDYDFWFGS